MALALKLVAIATPIVGGGIAIPLYLKNSQSTYVISASSIKATCEAKEVPSSSPNVLEFLGERGIEKNNYSYLSCKNTSMESEEVTLFDKDWTALFPKNALNEVFSSTVNNPFTMNVSVTVTKDNQTISSTEIIFSKPDTELQIKGRRGSYSNTKFGKKAVLVTIEEGKYERESIDIFTDSI